MSTVNYNFPTYQVGTDKMEFPKQLNDITTAIDTELKRVENKIPPSPTDITELVTRVDNLEEEQATYNERLEQIEEKGMPAETEARLDELQEQIVQQSTSIGELSSRVQNNETNISEVKQNVIGLTSDINEITERVTTNENDIQNIDNQILNINSDITEIKENIIETNETIDEITTNIENIDKDVDDINDELININNKLNNIEVTDLTNKFDLLQGKIVLTKIGHIVNIVFRNVVFNDATENSYKFYFDVKAPKSASGCEQQGLLVQNNKVNDMRFWVDSARGSCISVRFGANINSPCWGDVTYICE